MVADVFPAAAETDLGGFGGKSNGVTGFEAADGRLLATPLLASAVNVYETPAVSVETARGLVGPEADNPPGLATTV